MTNNNNNQTDQTNNTGKELSSTNSSGDSGNDKAVGSGEDSSGSNTPIKQTETHSQSQPPPPPPPQPLTPIARGLNFSIRQLADTSGVGYRELDHITHNRVNKPSLATAKAVLITLNQIRTERGLSELEFKDVLEFSGELRDPSKTYAPKQTGTGTGGNNSTSSNSANADKTNKTIIMKSEAMLNNMTKANPQPENNNNNNNNNDADHSGGETYSGPAKRGRKKKNPPTPRRRWVVKDKPGRPSTRPPEYQPVTSAERFLYETFGPDPSTKTLSRPRKLLEAALEPMLAFGDDSDGTTTLIERLESESESEKLELELELGLSKAGGETIFVISNTANNNANSPEWAATTSWLKFMYSLLLLAQRKKSLSQSTTTTTTTATTTTTTTATAMEPADDDDAASTNLKDDTQNVVIVAPFEAEIKLHLVKAGISLEQFEQITLFQLKVLLELKLKVVSPSHPKDQAKPNSKMSE